MSNQPPMNDKLSEREAYRAIVEKMKQHHAAQARLEEEKRRRDAASRRDWSRYSSAH